MHPPGELETPRGHTLLVLPCRLAICRLDASSPIPEWAWRGDFASVTRTGDEVSVVCPKELVPLGVVAGRGWRAFRVAGTQDLGLVGVLASLAAPIAGAGVSLFAIATFDTDYLLVREEHLPRASTALVAAGHAVHKA